MKNFLLGGLVVALIVLIVLFVNYTRTYSYKCEIKANMMGMEGWECTNYLTGKKISGFSTDQNENRAK